MPERVFSLSKEQQAAVQSFAADTGVSAAAGSGKTTVLVERYLEAVRRGAGPENILAVTFTDKAANVMKERLRRRCRELGLDDVRRRLDGAWIGTIHSFCARLLKENPVECAVDPAFTVLGAGEADVLMEEVLDRLFTEEAESELFLRLLSELGEDTVRGSLKAFYDHRRAEPDSGALLSSQTKEKELKTAERTLLQECGRILAKTQATGAPEEKLLAGARALTEALEKKTEGWQRLDLVIAAVKPMDLRSLKTKESVAALKENVKIWSQCHLQGMASPLKGEWRRLVEKFSADYEAEKRRLGSQDFEDLLCAAYKALDGDEPVKSALRERMRRQLQHIFVDEYQDTSLLQAGIIERLKQKDNLFVVGDVRQSIYRFRHAHPEIFAQAMERSRPFSLAENYRSRPEILEFVNTVFAGPSHEPLKPKRKFVQKKTHCLERIAVPKDERGLDALRVLEARSIAARIRAMVDERFLFEEKGKMRPAAYRDFAILMRKTTASRIYEKELEASGTPYFVNKGRGFYEKTEIADLVNFLRILENPSENVPLASVLRSPLVQLSDDGLFWLSKKRLASRPEAPLYTALRQMETIGELSPMDRSRLLEFVVFYDKLREQKDRLKLSEILHRIVDATAYEAKLLTRRDGRQARANVWKLIGMAGDVEDRNVRGISDFILYLKSVSESSETESEARVVGEDEDVVRILTIHAAKGLEFPCVILADLGAESGAVWRPPFLASPEEGLGARMKNPGDGETYEDATYAAILEREKTKDAEESDRLLYVAMTRAKEHLIFAGVLGETKEKGWMQRLSPFLDTGSARSLPVITRSPATPAVLRLADRIPEKPVSGFAERFIAQTTPADKKYRTLEDLSVSRLVSQASPHVEPEFVPTDIEEGEAENESTPRNEFGTVFHLVMELSTRHSPRGHLPPERLASVMATLTEEEKKEITAGLGAFWACPVGQEVKLSKKCYSELPFIYKTEHGLLKGQIDLVFKDAKGGWVILDHKTSRLSGASSKEEAVKTYAWQLGLYALAFWKLYGEMPKRTVLYFSSINEAIEVPWDAKKLEQLSSELEELYLRSVTPRPLDF